MRHYEDDDKRNACFESYLRLWSCGITQPTSMPTSQALRAQHEDRLQI